jgi:hypothetical protein
MESQDYGRYRDQVSDYYTELDRLYNQYNAERDYDYGKYVDDRNFSYGQFSDDRNLAYQTERDKVADQQWQAQFDEAKRQYDQQYALSRAKLYSTPDDDDDDEDEGEEYIATANTDSFESTLTPEANYDAIMRHKWGSYGNYVAQMVERARISGKLTDDEATYLLMKYKVSKADLSSGGGATL